LVKIRKIDLYQNLKELGFEIQGAIVALATAAFEHLCSCHD